MKVRYVHLILLFATHQMTTSLDEVGQGIKKSGVPREDFFLTTKLNNPDMGHPEKALEFSLKELDTPYLDLCSYLFKHTTRLI